MAGAAGLLVLLLVALVAGLAVLSAIVCRDVLRPPRRTAGYAASRGLVFDPGEAGYRFDAWTLDRSGASLPVWEIEGRKPPAARGAPGPTAVFVHDWGESRIDVLSRLGPWPNLCARLILYDRAGHGEAGGRALRRGEHGDLLGLLADAGRGPFLLVGRGTGAGVAIRAAAHCGPGHVAGIVAEQPVAALGPWLRGRLRSAGQALWPIADLARLWLAFGGAGLGNVKAAASRLREPLLVVGGTAAVHGLVAAAKSARAVPEGSPEVLQEFVRSCTRRGAPQPDGEIEVPPPEPAVPLADELVLLAAIAYRQARRVVVLVVGVSVVLVGVCMIVLPGPAFIVIPLGLAILGIEFAWARIWLRKIRSAAGSVAGAIVRRNGAGTGGAPKAGD